jgi:hypothetical protein
VRSCVEFYKVQLKADFRFFNVLKAANLVENVNFALTLLKRTVIPTLKLNIAL